MYKRQKELDAEFVKESIAAGMTNLKGHRSVGGIRASIYNAMPKEGVEKLVEFCSEMIDDRMEDGLTEEEAVAAAGSLDELIQQAKTELLPVKTANFPEKSTFGDTLRTYTAESSICGIIANCDYTADFKLLPSENGTCRVECMESEKICYSVTTENNVLHICLLYTSPSPRD